jgi:hypothetical protein
LPFLVTTQKELRGFFFLVVFEDQNMYKISQGEISRNISTTVCACLGRVNHDFWRCGCPVKYILFMAESPRDHLPRNDEKYRYNQQITN